MEPDDSSEIWLLFEQDGVRSLDEAEQHLLTLETNASSAPDLNGLYRALHSLKGNARVMGLKRLESITHKTEDLVGLCRNGTVGLENEIFQVVLQTCDAIRSAFQDTVSSRTDIPEDSVQSISERLDRILGELSSETSSTISSDESGAVFDGDFDIDFDFDFDFTEAEPEPGDSDDQRVLVQSTDQRVLEQSTDQRVLVQSTDQRVLVQSADQRVLEQSADQRVLEQSTDQRVLVQSTVQNNDRLSAAPAMPPPTEQVADPDSISLAPSQPPSTGPQESSAPPATATETNTPDPNTSKRRDTLIQVRASKIQELLSIASDLGLSTDSLLANPAIVALREESEDVTEQAHRLRRLMRDLRFSAASLALVPVAELFTKVRRIARDLARATEKKFDLKFDGDDTEIDKSLVDALSDPVLHIIRNAVDHGIESDEGRRDAQKPEKGRIQVSASYSGNEVLIMFSDDGRGIDPAVVAKKAIDKGLIDSEHGLDDKSLQRLIFHPGFSTKESVSELSGRGVGMDVVNECIKNLRGRIEIDSTVGRGTSLAIYLPLTLAFADALVVEIGSFLYAVPLENVGRIFLPEANDWSHNSADGIEYLEVKESTVPVFWLDGAERRRGSDEARQPIVTVRSTGGEMALPVDVLRGTEQITMRPLDRFSARHPAASSCGILSNGDIALTLDCERLLSFRTSISRPKFAGQQD